MSSAYDNPRKKFVRENTSAWDQFVTSITPGAWDNREKDLEKRAEANYQEKQKQAQLEALRKKRMNSGG